MNQKRTRILLSWILRILASTWRYSIRGNRPQEASVVVFWHGKMLPVWKVFSGINAVGVISLSDDGDALAMILTDWKYKLIRGSSSTRGREAMSQIHNALQKNIVLLTPDGPKGPPHQFKPGAVVSASRARCPLVLCNVSISWKFSLKTWDSFEIPLPFSRIQIELITIDTIPQDTERDEISKLILDCQSQLQ